MAKRQRFFKYVPLKDRSIGISLLAFVLAIIFTALAALLWYSIIAVNPSDASVWVAVLFTTVCAVFSCMAVITGAKAWLLLGIYWGV